MSEGVSLDINSQRKFTKHTKNIKQKLKSGKIKLKENAKKKRRPGSSGIVLLTHIPHGFYEKEMEEYFSQFGKILNLTLCRSMRTGQSKGYAFIQFVNKKVAKIAAETMDNYLMFKKRLTARYLEPSEAPSNIFKRKPISEENIPLERIRNNMNKRKNASISQKQYIEKCKRKLSKIRTVSRKLAQLGIEYDIQPKDVPLPVKEASTSKLNREEQEENQALHGTPSQNDTKVKISKFSEKDMGESVMDASNSKGKLISPKKSIKVNNSKTKVKKDRIQKKPKGCVAESDLNDGSLPKITKKKDKNSLKSINKAKLKLSKAKQDVKKLKSALQEYMADNFGKSKPVLRSRNAQKKSESVVIL